MASLRKNLTEPALGDLGKNSGWKKGKKAKSHPQPFLHKAINVLV